jgi:hypothetical protein
MTGDIWMAVFDKNAEFRRISLDKTMVRLIKNTKLEFRGFFLRYMWFIGSRREDRRMPREVKSWNCSSLVEVRTVDVHRRDCVFRCVAETRAFRNLPFLKEDDYV